MDKHMLVRPPQIMGKSLKILKVFKEIKRLASKDLTVLISGESGTYKELVAKAIHYNSSRLNGPFLAISLSSIPKDLIEVELFGYEKNTSKGATEKNPGKIEAANGGTLFLDEISEIDMDLQAKLVHFIQHEEFSLLGSNKPIRSNARIVGATDKNLKQAVTQGQFRKDFYECFNSSHIKVPSLKERREDITSLSKYFLEEAVRKFDTGSKEFSRDARDFLVKYDWPGNVRELENVIKRATILSNGPVIGKRDLMVQDVGSYSIKEFLEEKLKRYLKEMTKLENCNLYDTVLSEVEKSLIAIVLQETGSNQVKAAKTLGINRNTLRAKIKEYKIRI